MTRIEINPPKIWSTPKAIIVSLAFYAVGVAMNLFIFHNSIKNALIAALGFLIVPLVFQIAGTRRQRRFESTYVQWDDDALSYNVGKGDVTLKITDIKSVKIDLDRVMISTASGLHKFDMIDFEEVNDRQRIKDFFSTLPQA